MSSPCHAAWRAGGRKLVVRQQGDGDEWFPAGGLNQVHVTLPDFLQAQGLTDLVLPDCAMVGGGELGGRGSVLVEYYDLGADPTITNVDGDTPLIAAAGFGTPTAGEVAGEEPEVLEVIEWLLTIGADINAVDKYGETAMHGAAYKNLPKVVHFLANHGAKVEVWNQKNNWGWTPLLIAEGFRPGNFKPSFETIAAIHQAMLACGVTPPPPTSAKGVNNSDFVPPEKKSIP